MFMYKEKIDRYLEFSKSLELEIKRLRNINIKRLEYLINVIDNKKLKNFLIILLKKVGYMRDIIFLKKIKTYTKAIYYYKIKKRKLNNRQKEIIKNLDKFLKKEIRKREKLRLLFKNLIYKNKDNIIIHFTNTDFKINDISNKIKKIDVNKNVKDKIEEKLKKMKKLKIKSVKDKEKVENIKNKLLKLINN